METTLEKVEKLSGDQIVPVLERLQRLAYSAVPFEDLEAVAAENKELELLVREGAARNAETLPEVRSRHLGRDLLRQFAADEGSAALLETALADASENDDELELVSIKKLLTVGLLVNLTLFQATTKVTVEAGAKAAWHVVVEKTVASPEAVKAAFEAISAQR